jgi:cyanophycinase-like exopeptidase
MAALPPLSSVAESGTGWLALVGGGELTFGETIDADAAWIDKTPPGTVGFVPAPSGSTDYGEHFAAYAEEELERTAETIPIYRARDARRGRNAERIAECAAVYLGGGVADRLVEALVDTPAHEALLEKIRSGGVVAAIAGAAQALGIVTRSIAPGRVIPGLGWLLGGVVEYNFDPDHDRRLRKLLAEPGVRWGLGIPSGAAVLLGPEGAVEVVGTAFWAAGEEGKLHEIG